jgi:hypothetical protein
MDAETATIEEELVVQRTPAQLADMVEELDKSLQERGCIDHTVYIIDRKQDSARVEIFIYPEGKSFAFGHDKSKPYGRLSAQEHHTGTALVRLSCRKEHWPAVEPWWERLRAELERLGYLTNGTGEKRTSTRPGPKPTLAPALARIACEFYETFSGNPGVTQERIAEFAGVPVSTFKDYLRRHRAGRL